MADFEAIRARLNTDPFAIQAGIRVTAIGDGYAAAVVKVGASNVNTIDTAHGGLIFSVADEAFAAACNSDNTTRVAQSFTIAFTRPAPIGAILTATATRVSQSKKTALYSVEVKDEQDRLIAHCQCLAYSLGTPYIV